MVTRDRIVITHPNVLARVTPAPSFRRDQINKARPLLKAIRLEMNINTRIIEISRMLAKFSFYAS